jgi:microcystin degradation protein MlrC
MTQTHEPRLRLFTAGIAAETNTFSPIPTDRHSFEETYCFPAGTHPRGQPLMFSAPLWVAQQAAVREDLEVLEGLYAMAQPAGRLSRAAWAELRDELLTDLRCALPVDAVMLGLHGAMVADGCDDCEGDLLARLRTLVGPDVVVSVGMDPHCHLSQAMTEHTDILVLFKEYPHTDVMARAEELLTHTLRIARKQIRPVSAVFDCEMIDMYHTPRNPMRNYVDQMMALEREPGVVSVSLVHGFPWGDVADMGTKVLVYTDDQPILARTLAHRLGTQLQSLRGRTGANLIEMSQAVSSAIASVALPGKGPVVVSDGADNPGGGAPSDSTYLLQALRAAGAKNVLAGLIWDPVAVGMCMAAGEGARLDLRVGGKACSLSGLPMDLQVRVTRLVRGATQAFAGTDWPIGDVAAIEADGLRLVINSVRSQIFSTEVFSNVGFDVTQAEIVVVKSSQHFYASFAPIAKEVVYADTPGVCAANLTALPFQKLTRPKWPFDVATVSNEAVQ